MGQSHIVVGVEVSGSHLSAAVRPTGEPGAFTHDEAGIERLLRYLGRVGPAIVALDHQSVRDFLTETLQYAGFHVLALDSGERALAVASEWEAAIDVLICDIVLPRMSGYVLADALRDVHPETKILYISGHPDISAAVRRGFPERQRRFLLKPFYQRELLSAVGALLNQPRARRPELPA